MRDASAPALPRAQRIDKETQLPRWARRDLPLTETRVADLKPLKSL
jgi:hypothetical protein